MVPVAGCTGGGTEHGVNLETAFALPAIYSNQFAPSSDSVDGCVTEYPDGGWFEYEPATGRWITRTRQMKVMRVF